MPALYLDIAHELARTIQDGRVKPGESLPSLRQCCRSQGVSLMTALASYRHLEAIGLVAAVPRSGYRVLPNQVAPLVHPAILRSRLTSSSTDRADIISQLFLATADPAITPLGFGCPSPSLFPLAGLRRITRELLNSRKDIWVTYSTPPGCAELRRQIARRLQARGMDIGEDEILLTAGGMEALSLSLRLLVDPGDLVAVEYPTFFGVVDAARNAGARILELPGDPVAGLDPARLAAACARRPVRAAVLLPNFANPTGSLMPEDRRREWMKVLQANGVALVEDDIYGDLAWDGPRPGLLCATPRTDGLPNLLVGSLSKTLLPGGRVGYIAARSPWIERLADLKSTSTLANATLSEHVAAECLASGMFERHLRHLVPGLRAGVMRLRASIARQFPPGTRVSDPRGGFFLWVELPRGTDSLALFRAALKEGVSLAPGCIFSLGGGLDRFLRLNGAASGDLDQAVGILGRLAGQSSNHIPGSPRKESPLSG